MTTHIAIYATCHKVSLIVTSSPTLFLLGGNLATIATQIEVLLKHS